MNRREQSVKHLAALYTVVVGLALSSAIYNLVDPNGKVVSFEASTFILCVAFLGTLLPFYHGAMRHLDERFVAGASAKDGALLADFIVLFVEGCLLIAIAILIKWPVEFTQGYFLLLLVDVFWGILAYLAFSPKTKGAPELRWTGLNFGAATVLGAVMYWYDILPLLPRGAGPSNGVKFSLLICGISIVRTVLDYVMAWELYYPGDEA